MKTVTVELTVREAQALLYAYDIREYPWSNPLGREGYDLLETAETKLRLALGDEQEPEL